MTVRHREHPAVRTRRPGEWLIAVGVVCFVVGVVGIGLDFVPFLLGHSDRPLTVNLITYLAPLGLGLALLGLLRGALHSVRQSRAAELALEGPEI